VSRCSQCQKARANKALELTLRRRAKFCRGGYESLWRLRVIALALAVQLSCHVSRPPQIHESLGHRLLPPDRSSLGVVVTRAHPESARWTIVPGASSCVVLDRRATLVPPAVQCW
jgi:hypothetical protein